MQILVGVALHRLGGDGAHVVVDDRELHERQEHEDRAAGHPHVDGLHVGDGRQRLLRLRVLGRCKIRARFDRRSAATDLPSVKSDVTPRVTRAGIASGLIQNEIHDMTTISADGMYVWNKW